ncbi:MAG: InlB B-repeat-containing protein, partial [Anaerolineae bacterium]
LAHLIFSGNFAAVAGGGLFNDGDRGTSSPVLTDILFSGNQAGARGGGMHNEQNSSPTLTNVVFRGNQATWGGGLIVWGASETNTPKLSNVLFSGNQAIRGGGMALANTVGGPRLSLTNVTFSSNRADQGGGILTTQGALTLTNVILWGNTAITGTQMYMVATDTVLNTTLIQSSTNAIYDPDGTLTYGPGILTDDPQFVNPITATVAPTTLGDYHLQMSSPAIDAGDNAAVAGITTDLDGNPRILGGTVDLGPYEALTTNVYTLTLAVEGNGTTTPPTGPHVYEENAVVPITATADSGWEFAGWLGDVATPSAAATTVTMNADKTVTATFSEMAIPTYTLQVNITGLGSVTRAPDATSYISGTTVTLTAIPETGWLFSTWSGAATGSLTQTTVMMDADKVVNAIFSPEDAVYVYLPLVLRDSGN